MSLKVSQAVAHYAELLDPNSHADVRQFAAETIKINNLAHTVMHEAARVLEGILKAPLETNLTLIDAAEHYEKNPSELEKAIQILWQNKEALKLMRDELSAISQNIKNPSAPGASAPGA